MNIICIRMDLNNNHREPKLSILFQGWRFLQHSYGMVFAFQLVHLYKLYGPNGKFGHKILFYVTEEPYYGANWNNVRKLVYSEEYNKIISELPEYNGEHIDIIYRQTYPYNIIVTESNKHIPKCVFYTSEFADLDYSYFNVVYPSDINESQYNDYITLFLQHFNNIFFLTPSKWSSNGMKRYFVEDNEHVNIRNKIITHGVDSTIFYKFENNYSRTKIREQYYLKDNDILMMNIGTMSNNKGVHLILEALHILVNQMGKTYYKLLLKGSGDLYASKGILENYFVSFKQNNIMTQNEIDYLFKNHIIFINDTLSYSYLNDLFNAADLYISPYLAEGFGLTMLESLCAGLNILVPRTGSTKEYIEDIYINGGGGEEFITYVDSSVIINHEGKYMNSIRIDDLINTLLMNEAKIKRVKSEHSYLLMKNYIDEHYSWYKVAELLYFHLVDIVKRCNS